MEILKDRDVVTEDKRSSRVSIDYTIHYVLSTNALDVNFIVYMNCFPTMRDCETGREK